VRTGPAESPTVIESPGAILEVEADGHDFLADGRITIAIEAAALPILI
jgi:hypothetical protein